MSATSNLKKEHQLILQYVDLMERSACWNLENPESRLLFENAGFFSEFIREFADAFHHVKEEDILFRYLSLPGVLRHCDPIPQMLYEHDLARSHIEEVENALSHTDLLDLVRTVQSYVVLMKQHIFKEDNILYPMAEKGLSDELKLSIAKEYALTEERMESQTIWNKYEKRRKTMEKVLNERTKSKDVSSTNSI
ncbi:MAG: hemerythrin domain-containing protein [Methylosarcina sp.]